MWTVKYTIYKKGTLNMCEGGQNYKDGSIYSSGDEV